MTSNYVDETGLHIQTLTDIVADLETNFKAIYGVDINVDAASPDGQMINLFAQAKIDILNCIQMVYNSFSPSSAEGVALDQRCAINGVIRKGATNTVATVNVYLDRQTALVGIEDELGTPFTVSDTGGNQYYLVNGFTGATGVTGVSFIAVETGAIEVTPGSINKVETITLGVTGVYNTGNASTAGVDAETDAELRNRREVSLAMPSIGYLDGLTNALLALDGVTHAKVYENITSTIDADNIPGHSIWPVVEGGVAADIANAIYIKRSAGCGMTGATGYSVTGSNGIPKEMRWSEPTLNNLYINLVIVPLVAGHTIGATGIKQSIYDNFEYDIYEVADYSAIAAHIKAYDPLAVIQSGYLGSSGATGSSYALPPTKAGRWIVSTSRITITP
jgi:uncharacterized phage protein gp47/JayE